MTDFHYDDKGFQKLLAALKKEGSAARVGILGNSNTRSNAGETNAAIGVKHELGLGLPVRSFLRMPIETEFQNQAKSQNLITQKTLEDVLRTGTLLPILQKMAVIGERCVLLAFDSGGFGRWKPSDMRRKKVHQTLVESQQLRNSITSEVS